MKRNLGAIGCLSIVLILASVSGCASNPNLEGAQINLRNKDYQRALTNINLALEAEPHNSEALLLKGDILSEMLPDIYDSDERTEHIGKLTGVYAQAVRLDPENSSQVTRQRTALYRNEFSLAMEAYRDADQLGGHERADRFMTAARHFRNASMILPDSVDALINEAHAYYSAGEVLEAAEAYESAIALGNTERKLFIYLARTYELVANELADPQIQPKYYREMVRTLKTALDNHPNDDEIRKLLLNAFASSDTMTAEALPFFEENLAAEKNNQVYLYNYGTLLLRQEDYEGAITMLSNAVVLDSSYTNALFNLGAAYVNLGVQAEQDYQAVENSLQSSGIGTQEIARLEAQKTELEQSKTKYFSQAITHLETARRLIETELEDPADVCRALYIAYSQTDQRSRAEEARFCADLRDQ